MASRCAIRYSLPPSTKTPPNTPVSTPVRVPSKVSGPCIAPYGCGLCLNPKCTCGQALRFHMWLDDRQATEDLKDQFARDVYHMPSRRGYNPPPKPLPMPPRLELSPETSPVPSLLIPLLDLSSCVVTSPSARPKITTSPVVLMSPSKRVRPPREPSTGSDADCESASATPWKRPCHRAQAWY